MSRRRGFTLIEVLAVLFLTALVIGVALDFFMDLSRESAHATDSTRDLRRATSLVDRIARDVERTVLEKKPEDMDPLANPWVFLAEPKFSSTGADRVKFVRRTDPTFHQVAAASDLSVVAYSLEPHGDGSEGYELHRWSSPQLPDRLDRDFPPADDPASLVLADGIASFGMRFLGEGGEWTDRWDSSQITESSELPVAVEIEVALMPTEAPSDLTVAAEPMLYQKRVLLPMKPLDIETLTDPEAAAGEGGEDDELTVADCVDFSKLETDNGSAPGAIPNLSPEDLGKLQDVLSNAQSLPWPQYRGLFGNSAAVKAECK
jgi:prepilin-type N-terminal cleavage/methylation domain-containing protein